MNVYEAIANRRSIRAYQNRRIEPDKLRRVLEAGRLAPSARNAQIWRFVVVQDREKLQSLVPVCRNQAFVGQAAALIAGCATTHDHVMTCGQPAYPIDLAIALDHISLAAVEEGLGTCWIGAFFEQPMREALGIPADVRVVCAMTMGYPSEIPAAKSRKPFDEVFCFERYDAEGGATR